MGEDIERVQEAYRALKQLHLTSNDVNQDLLIVIQDLKKENEYLRELVINADKNVAIQKSIVLNSLTSSQEKHERDYQEIMELKNEIKRLKNK